VLVLEHGVSGARLQRMIGDWTHRGYPLLAPGPAAFLVTVRDVADAGERDWPAVADEWAVCAWAAWSAPHDVVRGWLAVAMGPRV
jgi:hypothetical protein